MRRSGWWRTFANLPELLRRKTEADSPEAVLTEL
jgi:hypothetical protein